MDRTYKTLDEVMGYVKRQEIELNDGVKYFMNNSEDVPPRGVHWLGNSFNFMEAAIEVERATERASVLRQMEEYSDSPNASTEAKQAMQALEKAKARARRISKDLGLTLEEDGSIDLLQIAKMQERIIDIIFRDKIPDSVKHSLSTPEVYGLLRFFMRREVPQAPIAETEERPTGDSSEAPSEDSTA